MNSLWYMLMGFSLGVYLGVNSPSCNKQKADDKPAAACPCEACDCCKECCEK